MALVDRGTTRRATRLRGRPLGRTEDFATAAKEASVTRLGRIKRMGEEKAAKKAATAQAITGQGPAAVVPPPTAPPEPVAAPQPRGFLIPTPSLESGLVGPEMKAGQGLGHADPSNPQPTVSGAQVAAARGGWMPVIADIAEAVVPPAAQAVLGKLDPFSAIKAAQTIHAKGKKMQQDVASTKGMVPAVSDPGAEAMRGIHEATRGFNLGPPGVSPPAAQAMGPHGMGFAGPSSSPTGASQPGVGIGEAWGGGSGGPPASGGDGTGPPGSSFGGCIIISACTNPFSYEVDVTRQFRDTHLTDSMLRGYYALARKVVPWLERFGLVKRAVKGLLVDRLIDYGEYILDIKPRRERLFSEAISLGFLGLIGWIGRKMKE